MKKERERKTFAFSIWKMLLEHLETKSIREIDDAYVNVI